MRPPGPTTTAPLVRTAVDAGAGPARPGPRTAAGTARTGPPRLTPLARAPVLGAAAAVTGLLVATSGGYGWHRDELYFRMLEPAWGYVDQPPLSPFLVRTLSTVVADATWAVRLPSALAIGLAVVVVALLTRELGGGRSAQTWSAWSFATAPGPLVFGHLAVTAPIDLLAWLLVTLCAVRALLRPAPAWWLAAGAVGGLATYDKWLVGLLVVAGLVGLLAVGPRRELRSPWLLGGVGLALVLAAPNLAYQAVNGWPQLAMGAALGVEHATWVRPLLAPFLLVLLGPPLVAVWVAGWVALWRRPAWRPVRFVAVAFPVLVGLTWAGGAQLYYPLGLLVVLLAAGWVPVTAFLARAHDRWRPRAVTLVAANGVVAAVVALPLLPVDALARTPVPVLSAGVADQLGWPRYVDQVRVAVGTLDRAERGRVVVVAETYGLAGALNRWGTDLPPVRSGHNHLGTAGPPDEGTDVVVLAGGQLDTVRDRFGSCEVVTTLDNGLGVATAEQGDPVAVCRDPRVPWDRLWAELRHLG
nr:glycosyltransferase family 39 protein [uncultured Actinotalea sp.]